MRTFEAIAAHEREAVAELHPLRVHPRTAERRQDARAHGVAVERDLDLPVHALEALLGEAEAGGVLVQALEHGLERRLGLLAAQPVHPQPRGGTRSELLAGLRAGGQFAQPRPALREERRGARLVAVERGAAAVTSSTTSNSTSAPAFMSSVRSAAASSAKFRSASWRARLRMSRGFVRAAAVLPTAGAGTPRVAV